MAGNRAHNNSNDDFKRKNMGKREKKKKRPWGTHAIKRPRKKEKRLDRSTPEE